MDRNELLLVAAVNACAVFVVYALARILRVGHDDMCLSLAAMMSVQVASWLHHRRSHTPAPMRQRLLTGIVMVVSMLAAGAILQWLFAPFAHPEISIGAALVGIPVFCIVMFGTMRRAVQANGKAPLTAKRCLWLAGVCMALAAIALAVARSEPAQAMTAVSLPGLSIDLPSAQEPSVKGNFASGKCSVTDAKSGQMLTVGWELSDDGLDEVASAMVSALPFKLVEPYNCTVDGHPGRTYWMWIPTKGKAGLMTIWSCPRDHRAFWIADGQNAKSPLEHQRIVASVRCHLLPSSTRSSAPTPPTLPLFVPPNGFRGNRSAHSIDYVGPNDCLIVLPGSAVHSLGDVLEVEGLGQAMLKKALEAESLTIGEPSRYMSASCGHELTFRAGRISSKAVRDAGLVVVTWRCEQQNTSFSIVHLSNGPADIGRTRELLEGLTCHAHDKPSTDRPSANPVSGPAEP